MSAVSLFKQACEHDTNDGARVLKAAPELHRNVRGTCHGEDHEVAVRFPVQGPRGSLRFTSLDSVPTFMSTTCSVLSSVFMGSAYVFRLMFRHWACCVPDWPHTYSLFSGG